MSAAPSKHEDRFTIVTIHAMNVPINRLMRLRPAIVVLVFAALQLNQPVRAESAIVNAGNALQILMLLGAQPWNFSATRNHSICGFNGAIVT